MTRKLIKSSPGESPPSCRFRVRLHNRRVDAWPLSDGDILFVFRRLPMFEGEGEDGKRIVTTRLRVSQEAVGAMFSLMNCLTREGII